MTVSINSAKSLLSVTYLSINNDINNKYKQYELIPP
jgi:hypothetical protein